MLPNIHHASTEQTASDRPDLTLYASLELSRATWLVTCLLPERDKMSKILRHPPAMVVRCLVC